MNLKCAVGSHDFKEACACARCGKIEQTICVLSFKFNRDVAKMFEAEATRSLGTRLLDSSERKSMLDILKDNIDIKRHIWDFSKECVCVRCVIYHAWILLKREHTYQRDSFFYLGAGEGKGLYEYTYTCVFCKRIWIKKEWEINKIG